MLHRGDSHKGEKYLNKYERKIMQGAGALKFPGKSRNYVNVLDALEQKLFPLHPQKYTAQEFCFNYLPG